jgi:hypothetical protein
MAKRYTYAELKMIGDASRGRTYASVAAEYGCSLGTVAKAHRIFVLNQESPEGLPGFEAEDARS